MATYSQNIVPQMTSGNTPTPYVVTQSSQLDATNYQGWKAFNRSLTGLGHSWVTANATFPAWLKIDLGAPKMLGKYSISIGSDTPANSAPKSWTLEGSNTGVFSGEQAIIHTVENETVQAQNEKREYFFANSTSYRYYRINITANQGNMSYASVGEIELMEVYLIQNILIFNNSIYKKYFSGNWQAVTSTTPTEADYLNGNTLEELASIPESAWQDLTGTIELSYYTEDTSKTEAQFNIETNPFTLADEWADQTISVIEYTDSPIQAESTTTIETAPFSFYDEMGNTFDVLYYTDDTTKTTANLEINANYSPLDELTDPSLVIWSDTESELLGKSINYTAVPKAKLIKQRQDFVSIVNLQKLDLTTLLAGKGVVKVLISGDSGATWKTFKTQADGTRLIYPVDISILSNVKNKGINPSDLSLLNAQELRSISPNDKFRLAYYIEMNDVSDSAKIDSLATNENHAINTPEINSMNILYDVIDRNYYGLLFSDTGGNYYSTSLGDVLKYLDFGSLIAGQTSLDVKVRLTSTYVYNIKNPLLTVSNPVSGLSVELSKTNAPFIAESSLSFPSLTLARDEFVDFYVRLTASRSAIVGGQFDIEVKAEPV